MHFGPEGPKCSGPKGPSGPKGRSKPCTFVHARVGGRPTHALAVYRYACRALFERHKLLLSLHLCAKLLTEKGDLNPREYKFFQLGGVVLDRTSQSGVWEEEPSHNYSCEVVPCFLLASSSR